jgi:ankyrin repeat protein
MKGVTPLHYAGWNNAIDVACLLIEHGANTYQKELRFLHVRIY